MISSHVRIYRFYQFVTARYTTDFYIIKNQSYVLTQLVLAYLTTVQSPQRQLQMSAFFSFLYQVFIDLSSSYLSNMQFDSLDVLVE